jgi:DNA-binding response OmpR family regulator
MLPDGTGIDLLKEIRKKNMRTPVLILSAKDTLEDKTQGYMSGTDDYMTKPFSFEELLLRVRALIRRKYQIYTPVIELGGLKLDPTARIASVDGAPLNLTAKEFSILELFLMRRSHILSRKTILEHLYSANEDQESNVIDVFINKLRRKLEAANVGSLIETVRGEGYVIR